MQRTYQVSGSSGDGAIATSDLFSEVYDIGIDAANNIFLADRNNHRVRRIDINTGIIDTVAGSGALGLNQAGLATTLPVLFPTGLWTEANSDFYITQGIVSSNLSLPAVRHVTY